MLAGNKSSEVERQLNVKPYTVRVDNTYQSLVRLLLEFRGGVHGFVNPESQVLLLPCHLHIC